MGFIRRKSDDEEGKVSSDDDEVTSESHMNFEGLRWYETFFQKAVAKNRNPAYDTRWTILDDAMVTFDATCAPSGITMLLLYHCREPEVVDLRSFRELRFLSISECPKVREMIGCECLEELRYLDVRSCLSYHGYSPLQKMPSLQEFILHGEYEDRERVVPGGELDVSGCVLLRRLEIHNDCALSSIGGLEELRPLTRLDILGCEGVRNLPHIGHMKDLTYLGIGCTAVEEIKGVERLSSLKKLGCWKSELKTLPDLTHLPHLQIVKLGYCTNTAHACAVFVQLDFQPRLRSSWSRVYEGASSEFN